MKIDSEIYKNFTIDSYYNEESKYFYATSKVANSYAEYDSNLKNNCHGFVSPKEAVQDVKNRIDAFLEQNPCNNYRELADAITTSLVWNGHEDCYVDEQILETLVEKFLKVKK